MSKNSIDPVIESTMGDYLKMPYNRYLWLRLEFMAICGDDIEAMIMRIVEYEIEGDRRAWLKKVEALAANGKPYPSAPEQWWVSLSYKQIMTRMYGAVRNEKTIIAKLKSLIVNKKYLQKRADPENPYGTPQYTINTEVVQEKLDKLPALPMVPDAAKLYAGISKDPVPVDGTPPSSEDQYQLVVPPVPVDGTPSTSRWHSPVPVDGTEGYQPVVPIKNSKNIEEKKETKEDSAASEIVTEPLAPNVAPSPSSLLSLSSEGETKVTEGELSTSETQVPTSMPIASVETTPSKPTPRPRVRREKKAEPIKKPEPALSEKARVVWEVWLQMPWNKEMAPSLTEIAAAHCEKLSAIEITVDIMFKIRNFAKKNDNNGFYEGKSWTLGNVVNEYPKWKSAEYTEPTNQLASEKKLTIADLTKRSLSSLARL